MGFCTDAYMKTLLTLMFSVPVGHSLDHDMSQKELYVKIPLKYTTTTIYLPRIHGTNCRSAFIYLLGEGINMKHISAMVLG